MALLVPMHDQCGSSLGLPYKQLACAALLAVSHFNSRSDEVVPVMPTLANDLSITPRLYDTSFSGRGALLAATDALYSGATAILGTARSTSTASTVQLSSVYDVPQLSYWASSPALSDADTYPLFSRTYASDIVVTQALCAMIASFEWAAIGIVHDEYDLYATAYANQLRAHAPTFGLEVVVSVPFDELKPETHQTAVEALAASRVNVMVAVLTDQDAPTFFEAAEGAGLLREGFVWIVADAMTLAAAHGDGAPSSAAREATVRRLHGLLQFYASARASGAGYERFARAWSGRSTASGDCANAVFDASAHPAIFTEPPTDVAAFVYDGAISLAAAVAKVGKEAGGELIHQALLNLSFDGASGHVAFDPSTGDRAVPTLSFALDNWVASNGSIVARRAGTFSLGLGLDPSGAQSIEWPGGGHETPLDLYEPPLPGFWEGLRLTLTSWQVVTPAIVLALTLPVALAARRKLREVVSAMTIVGVLLTSLDFSTDVLFVTQVLEDLMRLDRSLTHLSPTLERRKAVWLVCLVGSASVLAGCMLLSITIAARIVARVHAQDRDYQLHRLHEVAHHGAPTMAPGSPKRLLHKALSEHLGERLETDAADAAVVDDLASACHAASHAVSDAAFSDAVPSDATSHASTAAAAASLKSSSQASQASPRERGGDGRKLRATRSDMDIDALSQSKSLFAAILVLSSTNLTLLKLLPWRKRTFDGYPKSKYLAMEQAPVVLENVLQIVLQLLYLSVTPFEGSAVPLCSLLFSCASLLYRFFKKGIALVDSWTARAVKRELRGLGGLGPQGSLGKMRRTSLARWGSLFAVAEGKRRTGPRLWRGTGGTSYRHQLSAEELGPKRASRERGEDGTRQEVHLVASTQGGPARGASMCSSAI